MKYFRKFLFTILSILIFGLCVSIFHSQIVDAQTSPLNYPEIATALKTKLPNKSFKNKTELIDWLINRIKERRVDKPLTEDREADLRQAGATDELIEVIKINSPLLSKPIPVSSLIPTPTSTPIPTPTPKPAYAAYLEQGDEYFNKFDFDRAIEQYTKVLELDPQNVNALIQRGYARHYIGEIG